MSGYLDRINEANDIKKIEPEAYDALASRDTVVYYKVCQ